MNLITSNTNKLTSFELYKIINSCRQSAGENKIRVNDFAARIADELDGDNYESFVVQNPNKTETKAFILTLEQCMLVGMRESKAVRRSVLAKLKELEQKEQFKIPQTLPEALQLAADLALKIEQDKPKIEYHDRVLAADNGITTTEVASELGMSAIKLNRLLESMKVQRRVGGRWVLTASHLDQGLTVEVTHVDDGGKSRHSMKWTEAGRKLIHELVKE